MTENGAVHKGESPEARSREHALMIHRDGPALRALALIPYAYHLLDRGWPADIQTVRRELYDPTAVRGTGSVIKNDLEEVGGGWWLSSYDLWEEV